MCLVCQTSDGKTRFIKCYRQYGSLGQAAKHSKLSRMTIYQWMEKDPEFKALYEDELRPDRIDELVSMIFRAAMGRKEASLVQLRSAFFLLKAFDPKTYAEKYQMGGFDGEPVKIEFVVENPRDGDNKPVVICQPALKEGAGYPNLLGQPGG
jgi:hypothetical protein